MLLFRMYLDNIVPGMNVVISLPKLFFRIAREFFSLSQINRELLEGTHCSAFVC